MLDGIFPWSAPVAGLPVVLSVAVARQYLSGFLIGCGVGGVVGLRAARAVGGPPPPPALWQPLAHSARLVPTRFVRAGAANGGGCMRGLFCGRDLEIPCNVRLRFCISVRRLWLLNFLSRSIPWVLAKDFTAFMNFTDAYA